MASNKFDWSISTLSSLFEINHSIYFVHRRSVSSRSQVLYQIEIIKTSLEKHSLTLTKLFEHVLTHTAGCSLKISVLWVFVKKFSKVSNSRETLKTLKNTRGSTVKKIHHKNSSLMFNLMKTVCLKDMTRLPPKKLKFFVQKFQNFHFH